MQMIRAPNMCNVHKKMRFIYKTKCKLVSYFVFYCGIFTIDAFGL